MTSPTRWLGAALHGWWSARSGKVRALWIIVVAAPVFVGLHLLSKGDTERVVIAELGAPEIEDVASSLARRGIAYEERRTAGGQIALSVARRDEPRARTALREEPRDRSEEDRGALSWSRMLAPAFVTDSDERRDEEARRRVEKMICVDRKIEDAIVMFKREEPPLFGDDRSRRASASVRLVLAPRVDRLTELEAQSIRELVSGALGIDEDDVKVFDQARSYPRLVAPLELIAMEDRLRRSLEDRIAGLFRGAFHAEEFRVQAIVKLEEKEPPSPAFIDGRDDGERAGTLSARSSRATRRRAEGPVVRALRVSVLLDPRAVQRVLRDLKSALGSTGRSEPIAEDEIRRYLDEQSDLVAALLPYPRDIATVSVLPRILSSGETATAELATTERGAMERLSAELLSRFELFLEDPRRAAAIALIAVSAGGLLLVLLAWRRGVRRRRERLAQDRAVERVCAQTMGLASEVERIVRRDPDLALEIVRAWIRGEAGLRWDDASIEVVATSAPSSHRGLPRDDRDHGEERDDAGEDEIGADARETDVVLTTR